MVKIEKSPVSPRYALDWFNTLLILLIVFILIFVVLLYDYGTDWIQYFIPAEQIDELVGQ